MVNKPADIIQVTIAFWKAHTGRTLSPLEARESISNLSGFFELLNEWERREREADSKKPAGKEVQE